MIIGTWDAECLHDLSREPIQKGCWLQKQRQQILGYSIPHNMQNLRIDRSRTGHCLPGSASKGFLSAGWLWFWFQGELSSLEGIEGHQGQSPCCMGDSVTGASGDNVVRSSRNGCEVCGWHYSASQEGEEGHLGQKRGSALPAGQSSAVANRKLGTIIKCNTS